MHGGAGFGCSWLLERRRTRIVGKRGHVRNDGFGVEWHREHADNVPADCQWIQLQRERLGDLRSSAGYREFSGKLDR